MDGWMEGVERTAIGREGKRVCAYVQACMRERERERESARYVQYSEHLDIVPGGRRDN